MTIDEFKKVELRVGKVLLAERIPESEKLMKINVDLGNEMRQIIAGIANSYDPIALIGKEIVVVCNLEPRKLLGFESQGMLLAADGEKGPVILTIDGGVAPGTYVR
jgi:methionine--tRNA ligase beta chain